MLCALALLLALMVPARALGAEGYIRLHVVAEDDTDAAQALKLDIRDACLNYARELLQECEDADTAWTIINAHLDELETAVETCARDRGYMGPLRCETGVFSFPERRYGDAVVPAGDYRALRVVIGAGEGHNWWCVLFPSMCYPEELPEEGPVFYSSVWRWFVQLWGGDAV